MYQSYELIVRKNARLPMKVSNQPSKRVWSGQLLLVAGLFAALVFQLSMRVAIIEEAYRLERAREVALQNDLRLRELRYQYAALLQPGVLQERALVSLNMNRSEQVQIRRVSL